MSRVQFMNGQAREGFGRTVIVLGCGRGGTSAMAGALRVLGVALQDGSHILKHESSPVVYHGDQVDRRLTGSNLKSMDRRFTLWGWKSPRDLFSVHSWVSMVRNPMFVVVWRNQMQTTNSVMSREKIEFEVALRHVTEVYAELGRFVFKTPFPLASVDYAELCASPGGVLSEIADWLEIPVSKNQMAAASRFLRTGKGQYAADGSANVLFAPEEIAADQRATSEALYGDASAELETAIHVLNDDIRAAGLVLADLHRHIGDEVSCFPSLDPPKAVSHESLVLDYCSTRGRFLARSCLRADLQRRIDALSTDLKTTAAVDGRTCNVASTPCRLI